MTTNKNIQDILNLSVEEKILAVETIWDNIADEVKAYPLTEEQKQMLNERVEEYKKDPSKVRKWEEFKKDFLNK